MTFKAACLGASVVTGAELVRLLATQGHIEFAALSADRKAGQKLGDGFSHLRHLDVPPLAKIDEVDFASVDIVFCALPHGLSQDLVRQLPAHLKVRSEEHTSELQSLMRISYAVFCLKKKKNTRIKQK